MPSYKETIRYLYGLERLGIKPGLGRVRALLTALGGPEQAFPSVVIAGTNGKGSTAAMIGSVLREAGFRTGLYTSPHLVKLSERIRVNGRAVADGKLSRLAERVRGAGSEKLGATFFEVTTAIAFEHFRDEGVEVAVLETGLGGRLDATNVVTPEVSVITSIGLDHTAVLGSDIKKVAFEKAGIIKKSRPVVTTATGEALQVVKKKARSEGARLYVRGRDFDLTRSAAGLKYASKGLAVPDISLGLAGPFQEVNAAAAVAAVEVLKGRGFAVPARALSRGLSKVRWPGRFDTVRRRPRVVLDCAHNGQSAQALADALKEAGIERPVLVLAVMARKDLSAILGPLVPFASIVVVTSPSVDKAVPAEVLKKRVSTFGVKVIQRKTVAGALRAALKEATSKGRAVCVAGSVYMVGEAVDLFKRGVV